MRIEMYNPDYKQSWDKFIEASKNGIFLFYRDYMEYHVDRFQDNSLIAFDNENKIIAVLPAHKADNVLLSHGGLTYGGWITNFEMKTPLMLEIFSELIKYLKENNFIKLLYKTIPNIHHLIPAEEDRYALFLANAKLVCRNVLTIVELKNKLPFQTRRIRSIKKAINAGLEVRLTDDYENYWKILADVLWQKHKVKPVHNLDELLKLKKLFPDNIKLCAAYKNSMMVAGVVIYETNHVVRSQYIASSDEGRESGALDLIFDNLLNSLYPNKRFFDFGPSNEDNGLILNHGLIDQKEGFGGRAIVHDHYEIAIDRI